MYGALVIVAGAEAWKPRSSCWNRNAAEFLKSRGRIGDAAENAHHDGCVEATVLGRQILGDAGDDLDRH